MGIAEPAIFKFQYDIVITAMRYRVITRRNFKTRMPAVNEKTGYTFFWTMRSVINASSHENNKKVGMIATRDEMLGAVDDPVTTIAAIAFGRAIHAANIRTGIGFCHGKRIHPFTTHGR